METLVQDFKYAIRILTRNPGFGLMVVVILALGIGANSAMFTLINGVLLAPLPYKDADSLVAVNENRSSLKKQDSMVSGPEFTAWTERNTVFAHTAAISYESLSLTGGAEPESLLAAKVSSGFLSVMGVSPEIGRFIIPEEDVPGAAPVALLSNSLWQRRFGSDPGLIGNSITLGDKSYTVIGVMPSGFEFPPPPPGMSGPDLWVPIAAPLRQLSGLHNLYVVGRLKPGVSIQDAQKDIGAIAYQLGQEFPESNTGHSATVVSLHERLVGDVKPVLLILAGAVAFVLLIACANAANLMLSRAASRRKEIAIRMSLGAGRSRLIRQLLTESTLLALIGGASGLLLAFWIVGLIPAISPVDLPFAGKVTVDFRVVVVTFALSLLAGLISGVAPAIRAGISTHRDPLKDGTRTSAGAVRRPVRNTIVIAEVALALVLLIGAGLMIKSFARLTAADAGFNPRDVLAADLTLPPLRYPKPAGQRAFFEQLSQHLSSLPGVQTLGATNCLPLSGAEDRIPFSIEGRPEPGPGDVLRAGFRVVSSDYFTAMDVQLLKGRFFEPADARIALPLIRWYPQQPNPPGFDQPQANPCAIINAAMARSYWPGEDPIGHKISVLFSPPVTIVGIVGDIKHSGLDAQAQPEIYLSNLQEPQAGMTLVIKTSGDPAALAATVRQEVQALDKDQPLSRIRTMRRVFSDSVSRPRFNALLLAIFGAMALGLSAVGIFAVINHSVGQRTHELGIRMALGARPQTVVRAVVRESMILTLAGMALGLFFSFPLTRLLSGLLYGVGVYDPSTFALVSCLLGLTALLATYLPARKAASIDPVEALRFE